jgi:subtilisin family serine protease
MVRIAIVDSGVHAAHPHVGGVAGGVCLAGDGADADDYVDRLGHGTAVAAAIREKAPASELYAVKVFDRTLVTRVELLVAAIDWAIAHGMHLVNMSLGTPRQEHAPVLSAALQRAADAHVIVVAAGEDDGVRWLPGCLPGVLTAVVDAACPREEYRAVEGTTFRAAPYPREIPGVPRERNYQGPSFAVANLTGFAARALEGRPRAELAELVRALRGGLNG